MKGYKEVFKIFLATQLDKEEAWLNEMSKQGYELMGKKGLCTYLFKELQVTEYVYMISYYGGMSSGDQEFVNVYTQMGFEYITHQLGYYYFKCKAKEARVINKNTVVQLEEKRNVAVSNYLITICVCNMPAALSILHSTMERQGSGGVVVGISFLIAVNFFLMGMALQLRSQKPKYN